jgi:hypothetical protein
VRKLELELRRLEEAALEEVDNAAAAVATGWERVQATREARAYAAQALAAEQRKLDSGKSTSFVVLQLQRDWTRRGSRKSRRWPTTTGSFPRWRGRRGRSWSGWAWNTRRIRRGAEGSSGAASGSRGSRIQRLLYQNHWPGSLADFGVDDIHDDLRQAGGVVVLGQRGIGLEGAVQVEGVAGPAVAFHDGQEDGTSTWRAKWPMPG